MSISGTPCCERYQTNITISIYQNEPQKFLIKLLGLIHDSLWLLPLGYIYLATAALSLVASSTRSTISLLRMMNVVGMPLTL